MFVKPNIASQNRIKNGIRLKTVYGLGFMVQGKKDGMRFGGLKDSWQLAVGSWQLAVGGNYTLECNSFAERGFIFFHSFRFRSACHRS